MENSGQILFLFDIDSWRASWLFSDCPRFSMWHSKLSRLSKRNKINSKKKHILFQRNRRWQHTISKHFQFDLVHSTHSRQSPLSRWTLAMVVALPPLRYRCENIFACDPLAVLTLCSIFAMLLALNCYFRPPDWRWKAVSIWCRASDNWRWLNRHWSTRSSIASARVEQRRRWCCFGWDETGWIRCLYCSNTIALLAAVPPICSWSVVAILVWCRWFAADWPMAIGAIRN